jgi:signal transduction histidine kinase
MNAREGAPSLFVPILHIALSATEKVWRLTIKDNGMGIDEETQKNLLTPFYSTKQGGTGLGLFLTKKMIEELHHGKMTLSSKKGAGTTVLFEVPFL